MGSKRGRGRQGEGGGIKESEGESRRVRGGQGNVEIGMHAFIR